MISIESPQMAMSARTSSLLRSKLAIRDSFDDEMSDEADDEVFIQDGRNGVMKHEDECGMKRPLMPPRMRKGLKSSPFPLNRHRRAVVRALWAPCCYAGLFMSIFLIVIGAAVLLINSVMNPPTPWTQQRANELLSPSVLVSSFVWNSTQAGIMSESNLYLHDVNKDGAIDILLGFGTAVDKRSDPGFMCVMYYRNQYPCYGGVLALSGRSGDRLWQHWSDEPVFALDCGADLTGDTVNDCLATGKRGLFSAVNGRDGSLVWNYKASDIHPGGANEVYSPRFITDVDGDGVQDVIASHTGNSAICGHADGSSQNVQGHLLVLSGSNGQMLQCVPTPNHIESFTTPQVLVWPDGGSVLLIGTGGPHTPGGLYGLPLHPQQGMQVASARMLYQSEKKGGMLVPSLLLDITSDGAQDIVAAMFDSIVLAFDGATFKPLWNYSIPSSEIHSPISAGYFNDDDIPDILVRFHLGPGYPSYHYSQTLVLDGRNGKPLLEKPLSGAPSADNAPGLSLEGHGNDAFLVWSSGCLAHEAAVGGPLPPSAREGTAADWDRCDPKFNSTSSDLKLITHHMPPPGIHIFHTEETPVSQETKLKKDYSAATSYIEKHPDFWDEYSTLLCSDESDTVIPATGSASQPGGHYHDPSRMQEQNEDIYLNMPHQVRKHGNTIKPNKPPVPRQHHTFVNYQDYDTDFIRPLPDNGNNVYNDAYNRRTKRQVESTNHKILSSHISSGVVAPGLKVTTEGVDLIFTSHWSVPKDTVLPAFQLCVTTELAKHRANKKRSVQNCKRQAQVFMKTCWNEATKVEGNSDRPFGASRMAHLSVHRINLQLECMGNPAPRPGQRCAGILPWGLQSIPASPGTTLFHSRNAGVRR